jgi:hypothetical protein
LPIQPRVFLAAHGVRRVSSLSNATPICSYILSAVRGINSLTVELFRQVGLEPPPSAGGKSYVNSAIGTRLRADPRRDSSRRGIYAGIDEEEEGITHLTQTLLPVPRRSERSIRTRRWRSSTPGPVRELGADDVRFATELMSFEQDDGTGVIAVL